ncbi:MAG: hypothetical protein ACREKL_06880, partial [Chthoniobacterales bacterium]
VYQFTLKILRPIRVTLAAITSSPVVVGATEATANEYYQHRAWSVISRDGEELKTEKFLNTVEDADELLALDEKEKLD